MEKTVKNYKTQGEKTEIQKILDKIFSLSVYVKIFAVLALVFFILGISTLGSLNGTGKSAKIYSSSEEVSMAYRLTYEEDNSHGHAHGVAAVYINVGAIYEEAGESLSSATLRVRINYYDGEDWLRTFGSTSYISNIYTKNSSDAYKSNANYNWVALATDGTLPEERSLFRINFLANSASAQINEVVFVDTHGDVIKAKVAPQYCVAVPEEEVEKTLDAQGSFHASDSYRYNFSYEEEYILESIHGIELGATAPAGDAYIMSTDYNSLGILVYALSTWIFGKSTFGLRLPSFLATFGLFILLFFFGKKLFKSEKWGLIFSALFGLGGLFFSVGRMGTPLALALLVIVASIYLMYGFYTKGIDSANPVKTALPVFFSGLLMTLAFCINSVAVFPCLVSVALFALGLVRLFRYRDYRIAKAEESVAMNSAAEEVSEVEIEGEVADEKTAVRTTGEEEIRSIHKNHGFALKLAVSFFAGSILIGFIVLLLAALPTNFAFARYYGEENFFTLLGHGIAQCFTIADVTPYTAGNAFTPFSWFLALKGATVFDKSASAVLQVNAQANVLMAYASAVAFVFCTVYVFAKVIANKHEDKRFNHILKVYIGLFVCMMAGLIPYLATVNASAVHSYTFNLFYSLFIALAFYILEGHEKPQSESGDKKVGILSLGKVNLALLVLFALFAVIFILTLPMAFGWSVSATAADVMFYWTSLISNGNYGLIPLK